MAKIFLGWLLMMLHYQTRCFLLFFPMLMILTIFEISSRKGALHDLTFCTKWMSQPHFGQVWGGGVKPNTPKVGDLESSETLKCLEFDNKAQNTSHWGVLGVIAKVLKRNYRKWLCIGHLDICSPSYGQKKGRESNWQFDSRPLKVKNRPFSNLQIESAIRR